MKKVLLINPPYPLEEAPSPPFGLMSLAAYLLQNGHDVIIEDYIVNPYSPERVAQVVKRYRPDVIGSTGVTMNIKGALAILEDYRREAPESVIIMGGPHVTFDADNILRHYSHVDVIVRGEGEATTQELLDHLGDIEAYKSVSGISYRDRNNVLHNEKREFIEDINILPYPARHLVQHSKYKALGLAVNIVTSRGCPFECIFCVGSRMVGRRVRYYDIKRVVDEFEMLTKLGFSQINVVDDLFTSNKKRCIAICDEIKKRGITHPWTAFARVDTVSEDLLESLKSAGCTTLCFGIESGSQEILDRVKKKTNLAMCRKAVELCNRVGIEPMASYILGLPGESPDSVLDTMDFAKNLCKSYGYHVLAPFPGTEVREKSEEYGMRILTDDWDLYDANRSVCESVTMPHEEVDRIVNDFYGGVKSYVLDTLKDYENGKSISPGDMEMVKKIQSFDFSYRLISDELIEKFNDEMMAGGLGEDDLIPYLAEKTGLSGKIVSDEVKRLYAKECLTRHEGSGVVISWS